MRATKAKVLEWGKESTRFVIRSCSETPLGNSENA